MSPMSAMDSQITGIRQFAQQLVKASDELAWELRIIGSLWREFFGGRWIPSQKFVVWEALAI